jgi:hypothetical protein
MGMTALTIVAAGSAQSQNRGEFINDPASTATPARRFQDNPLVAGSMSRSDQTLRRYDDSPGRQIINLVPIPLQTGGNRVPQFSSDGRDANIMLAWHADNRRNGYDIFLVTMPNRHGNWRTVGLLDDASSSHSATITDDPNRGDDALRSVRFARGKIDGQNATLLLVTTRLNKGEATPSEATYEVYRLVQIEDRDVFERVSRRMLPGSYCNADMALSIASGLSLRSSYRGPRDADNNFTADGCRAPLDVLRPAAKDDSPIAKEAGDRNSLSPAEKDKLFQQFLYWYADLYSGR